MSKISETDAIIKELRKAADAINFAANALADYFAVSKETAEVITTEFAPEKEAPKQMTLQEVRAILAEKSRNGHRNDVRELLLKYGSDKLSGIDPDKYSALVAETEEWKDAT